MTLLLSVLAVLETSRPSTVSARRRSTGSRRCVASRRQCSRRMSSVRLTLIFPSPTNLSQVAMESFLEEMLGGGEAADRIRGLWNEYEAGQTPEAKFVKDLDRLELCLQTVEYERRKHHHHLIPLNSLSSLRTDLHPHHFYTQATPNTTSRPSTPARSLTSVILPPSNGHPTSWPSAKRCLRSGARLRRARSRTGSGTRLASLRQ